MPAERTVVRDEHSAHEHNVDTHDTTEPASGEPGDSRAHASLACVTVSYHSAAALGELLESLGAGSTHPVETIVVNNAPEDELNLDFGPLNARIINAGRNLGYGAAVNAAVASLDSSVEWVLVTNPDVRVGPNAIERLLATALDVAEAGAVGPRIVDVSGATYPSARELPSLRTGVGHALFANIWPGNPWTRKYRGENRLGGSTWQSTGWLSGACLLVRRSAFDAVGGFDESYFMYFEDVDLGKRLTEAGWLNVYVPTAAVVHTGAHSTERAASTMRRVHHESAYRYLARKYQGWYLWPLRAALWVGLVVRSKFSDRA